MELIINNDHGGFYYDLFYRLSFLICFLIFLFEGWRRKYPISTLLLISTVGIFFTILGSKLSAGSMADWGHFFETGSLPVPDGRSSFGALLLGWLGIGIAQRALGFKHSVLDLYILAIPVALISQRIGCLVAGCCFGSTSTLPWAIHYGDAHAAWKYHYAQGLIQGASETSLAVHPVQVYFILAYILCILIVLRFRGRFRANGNLALFGLMLLFGFRFFIEFFRDPITNHGWGETVLGIKQIQWLLLFILLLLTMLIRYRERMHQPAPPLGAYTTEKHFLRKLALWSIPLLGLMFLPAWFSFSEITVMHSHLVFAGLALAWIAFYRITHPRRRGITAVVLVLAIFSMGQTYKNMPIDSSTFQPREFYSFSFGFLEGRNLYDYDISKGTPPNTPRTDECSSSYPYRIDHYDVGPHVFSGGVYYERLKEVRAGKYNGLILGAHLTEYNIRENGINTKHVSDVGFLIDRRWLRPNYRIDLGYHLGRFDHINGDRNKSKFTPLVNLRLGPQEKFFFDAGYGNDLPYGLAASSWKVGGGIGLPLVGVNYKAGLLFGITNIGAQDAYYLSPFFPIGRFDLQPTFRFSREEHMNNWGLIMKWHLGQERPFQMP